MTKALRAVVGALFVAWCWHVADAQVPPGASDPLEYLDASRRADELLALRDYARAAAVLKPIAETSQDSDV